MITTANYLDVLMDTRLVRVGGEFFDLEQEQIIKLAQDFYEFVMELYGELCVLTWSAVMHGDLKDSKIPQWIAEIEVPDGFGFDGMLRSDQIKNKTQFQRYLKKTAYSITPTKEYTFFSEGYGEYYERYILDSWPDIEKIMQGIETICNIEGKKPLDYYTACDCGGSIHFSQNRKTGLYYGSFIIYHSVFSLDADIDGYLEKCKDFLYALSRRYIHFNLHLGFDDGVWNPSYMRMFGNSEPRFKCGSEPNKIKLEDKSNKEFFHYLIGTEWLNIVSPTTARYLGDTTLCSTDDVAVSYLEQGQLSVSCNCDFLAYDIPQAKAVKRILYDALYPGGCLYIPFRREHITPRHNWEIIPVFPEEIQRYKYNILVAHKRLGTVEPIILE